MSIDVSGLENAGLIRRAMIELVPGLKKEVIRRYATEALKQAQDRADTHTKTGALVRSVKLEKRGEGYAVVTDPRIAPHAAFVHWGTRPHEIKPVNKKALRWATGGGFAFAKRVQHPGYAGDPFLEFARDRVAADFDRIVSESFAEVRSRLFNFG